MYLCRYCPSHYRRSGFLSFLSRHFELFEVVLQIGILMIPLIVLFIVCSWLLLLIWMVGTELLGQGDAIGKLEILDALLQLVQCPIVYIGSILYNK